MVFLHNERHNQLADIQEQIYRMEAEHRAAEAERRAAEAEFRALINDLIAKLDDEGDDFRNKIDANTLGGQMGG